MSLKNFFSKENSSSSKCKLVPDAITVELLKTLIPIRSLSDTKLESFAVDRFSEVFPVKTVIFTQGSINDSAYYLLQGTVTISDEAGTNFEVEAGTPQAKFPLCSGIKHILNVTAKTDVSILRVSQKIMATRTQSFHHPSPLTIPDSLINNRLLQSFAEYYQEETIEVPSFPDIALRLRKAMKKDIGIADAVKIIQLDPVITAKLIQVANCPLYLPASPSKTCFEAAKRIGLKATQNLVIMLSMKQIFQSNEPLINKFMNAIWKQSIYISSICYVLAQETKKVNPEEALLAGLVSEIGIIPFLNFAANLPSDFFSEKEILSAIPIIRGPVGAYILHEWDFPMEIEQIPLYAEDWYQHNDSDQLNLIDIVVLSKLHSKIGKPEMAHLPAITSIPAASKLDQVLLSPENSLHIIHDAQRKINEAKQAFLH